MTSSIDDPRSELGACEPSTQDRASAMFDLPDPLGPTMTFTPRSNSRIVGTANDLKPSRRRAFTYMGST
jgi:hypothetical protein